MRLVTIYQTLEDRGNYKEVEDHGPYFCAAHDENGQLKKGTKEPWLGEGYYFWDTRKTDAQWWGKVIYESHFKGYVRLNMTSIHHCFLICSETCRI